MCVCVDESICGVFLFLCASARAAFLRNYQHIGKLYILAINFTHTHITLATQRNRKLKLKIEYIIILFNEKMINDNFASSLPSFSSFLFFISLYSSKFISKTCRNLENMRALCFYIIGLIQFTRAHTII